MTIESTADTIVRWAGSCINEEQLLLCVEAKVTFLYNRFRCINPDNELMVAMNKVNEAIMHKMTELCATYEHIED